MTGLLAYVRKENPSLRNKVRDGGVGPRLAVFEMMRRIRKADRRSRILGTDAGSVRHLSAKSLRLRVLRFGAYVLMVVFYLFEAVIFFNMQEQMLRILATQYALYTKIWGFHWNLVGTDFAERHGLYGSWKDELGEDVDVIAERIRQLGGVAF